MTGTEPKLLIIGFSNVATKSGFSIPTIERLKSGWPGLKAFRVGLGALQPQVIPPYIRTAAETLGPFTHVLLEINSSAYAMHPLSTEENGRELLADILLTVQDCGAEAAFMLHLRHWTRQIYVDFDALVRRFCTELDLPMIDLAEGWIAQHGASQIAAWMRDETHTTKEGGEAMAETLTPFLIDFLNRKPSLTGRSLPRPRMRRGVLPTAPMLAGWPREQHECLGLPLDFARIEEAEARIQLGRTVRAQGLVYMFHRAGGRNSVALEPSGEALPLTTIDPNSNVSRVGVLAFDRMRGFDLQGLTISSTEPAEDIHLHKGVRERPLRIYVGPILTLEPVQD
ncbi:hypothetical protein [Sulfitobacter alexandrii]|uniref:hypothetical protein n=1 Tax=Sulfitobacter alexandrii TaxID=1917485 RepID=UPI0012EC34AB|nr:hypothetical protein [Sulfitobacter alexandrii]